MRLWKRRPSILWPTEIGAVGIGSALWGAGEYLRVRRAPSPGLERRAQRALNRLDAVARQVLFRPQAASAAERASDALAFVAAPLGCGLALLCVDDFGPRLARDVLRVGRAVTLTGSLNQAVKLLAPRERPFARYAPELPGKDRYGSFFSNHTSAVTAMTAAAARLVRARGARSAFALPLLALAALVGYLRIAADKHYLSDVLAGAAIGALLGVSTSR